VLTELMVALPESSVRYSDVSVLSSLLPPLLFNSMKAATAAIATTAITAIAISILLFPKITPWTNNPNCVWIIEYLFLSSNDQTAQLRK